MNKIHEWVNTALIVVVAILVLVGGNSSANLGGTTNFDLLDTTDGYAVDGTTVINGSGVFVGQLTSTSALTQGGGIRATSTINSAETLTATDFDTENVIAYTLNVQSATLTLPASSTLSSFIPTAGQMRTVLVRNATTTAGLNLTIAGGTGTILKKATSTAVIYSDTDGDNYARLDFVRKTNSDIDVLMSIFAD